MKDSPCRHNRRKEQKWLEDEGVGQQMNIESLISYGLHTYISEIALNLLFPNGSNEQMK